MPNKETTFVSDLRSSVKETRKEDILLMRTHRYNVTKVFCEPTQKGAFEN